MNLNIYQKLSFIQATQALLTELHLPIKEIADEPLSAADALGQHHKTNDTFALIKDVYIIGMLDDAAFKGRESAKHTELTKEYEGILFFGVQLEQRTNNLLPTRSQLADIARAFNRQYQHTPVVVLYHYADESDQYLAFANTERTAYKQTWREGEKAGKVSLLRDISVSKPHRGHEDIISSLQIPSTGKNKIESFEALYTYWQKVFSVNVLNKKFYKELSTWYFWAIKHVTFPGEPTLESVLADTGTNDEKVWKERIQEHKAKNVIRLLTRLLFTWFIKEKKLIPDALFDLNSLQDDILKEIAPSQEGDLLVKASNESVYYKAILQNLFFATLNCPIAADGEDKRTRGFRGVSYGTHRGVDYLMRYQKHFKDPEAFLGMMNETVPFLNGGLFECLDVKHSNLYIDGFSDQMTKGENLVVPDYLFFGLEKEEDLSEEYGIQSKETKQAAVKGLINILKSYKFTITENTPIEEDVALDPELLGKVFENLLASYNPETKTTARKQTGSFYTPREIVNYMVDESLITYLKNELLHEEESYAELGNAQTTLLASVHKKKQLSLETKPGKAVYTGTEEQLDEQLHQLFAFDEYNPFSQDAAVTKTIIKALDSCKILDPACGSGAYPMGILQKMVHVLTKLDPQNQKWKDLQIAKAQEASKEAFDIDDKEEREKRLIAINDAFDEKINDADYARKLFLIENCIYGVDIQPVATQISKLRFFISLVVEQKVNADKPNFGIRPLPNLETKFVAANTLIGIDKSTTQVSIYETPEVKQLERELKSVRHKLFGARTKETKLKYRDEDERLRNAIAAELVKTGWANDTAEKLASWDPYDQNASSSFFDPEWMFDVRKGFQIIIGNPPWGAHISKSHKSLFKKSYPEIDSSTPNSFAFFIGEAMNHSNGIVSYILPDSILIKDYSKTRKLLMANLYEISWYSNTGLPEEFKPFVYVEHDVCILQINKFREPKYCKVSKHEYDNGQNKINIQNCSIDKRNFILKNHAYTYNLKIGINQIKQHSYFSKLPNFGTILQCHEGIHTGNSRDILFHKKLGTGNYKPLFYGGRAGDKIVNYISVPSGWFVDYRKSLIDKSRGFYASLRNDKIFCLPKIYVTRTGNPIKAFYDQNTYASNNFFSVQFKEYSHNTEENLKRILPLILSKFANYYIRTFAAPRLGNTFIETKIIHLMKVPIPNGMDSCISLSIICEQIIFCIAESIGISQFQNILDSLIFNLYFPDHMKELKIDVQDYIAQDIAAALQDHTWEDLANEQKLEVIDQLHATWTDPSNEVVKRMSQFKEKSPDILKVIMES